MAGVVKRVPVETVKDEYARRSGGGYWFSKSTMRDFSSRLMGTALWDGDGTLWFVTSERPGDGHSRRYTVRVLGRDGSVDDVGAFLRFGSRNGAMKAMYRWATAGVPQAVLEER